VSVRDGDTIEVMRDGRTVRVRLWGIDCPEQGQAFGTRARQFTAERAFGKEVGVEVVDIDRYGRIVGRVTADGRDLNLALVQEGLAWWYEFHAPHASDLEAAQRDARQARRGLWADAAPVQPWEFRRQHPRTT
jgi:endonuclease YncB( thermonuclease family)